MVCFQKRWEFVRILPMVKIEPLGCSSFKVTGREASLIVDPFYQKATGLPWAKRKADLVLVSADHPECNNAEGVSGVAYVVSGPGEYEIRGVSICGFPLEGSVAYQFHLDNLSFLYLGGLRGLLVEEQLSQTDETDILFIPVGGVSTIGAEEAAQVVAQVEPKITIPMHYQQETKELSALAPVEKFVREMGGGVERMAVLSLKSGMELPEESSVVILE